ncbi:putative HTH-type transcriptional regulator YurK [Burkholderia cepacia]|nr:putative HTH-type transcriptional regulator YurK [Burkholderia cepacia]
MKASTDDRWQDLRPDPDNDTPLYLQLARKLGDAIHDNRWTAGEALPSERVLSDALGVSRITARKAIALLVEQGLIRRTQAPATSSSRATRIRCRGCRASAKCSNGAASSRARNGSHAKSSRRTATK